MSTLRSHIRELTQQGRAPVSAIARITEIRVLSPGYTRVTLLAPGLAAYAPTLPADAIKLGVPGAGGAPELRAMTVSQRPDPQTIAVDILRHAGGVIGPWLDRAQVADHIEVHAVRREYAIGDGIADHLIVADASALPAVATILHAIPKPHRVRALVHASHAADAAALLPAHPGLELTLRTGDPWTPRELRAELTELLAGDAAGPAQAWVAAEAANTAAARRVLAAHGHPRDHLFAAAYWKAGSDSTTRDARIRAVYADAAARQADPADPGVRTELEQIADDALGSGAA